MMSKFWNALAVVAFIVLVVWNIHALANATAPSDLYFSFAIGLAKGFPLTPLMLAVGVPVVLLLFKATRDAAVPVGFLFFLFLVVATLSGAAYLVKMKYGCTLATSTCYRLSSSSVHMTFGELVGVTLGTLASAVYLIAWAVALPALAALAVTLPGHIDLDRIFNWFFSGKHPASDVVKRSSRDIAQEFARVMQAQNYDDLRARQLFTQMGPLRQRMWRAKYEARTKEADRLRAMVDAQTRARNADSDLGFSVLERERARRR